MSDTCHNCEAVGGAQAKTGDNRLALSRPAGMNATGTAIGSKTRSAHHSSASPYLWVDAPTGYGENENIKGYGG